MPLKLLVLRRKVQTCICMDSCEGAKEITAILLMINQKSGSSWKTGREIQNSEISDTGLTLFFSKKFCGVTQEKALTSESYITFYKLLIFATETTRLLTVLKIKWSL